MEEFVVISQVGDERGLCFVSRRPFLGKLADALSLADDLRTSNRDVEYKVYRVVEYAAAGKVLTSKAQFNKLVQKLPPTGIKPRKAKVYDPYSTKDRAAELTEKRSTIQRVLRKRRK